MCSLAEVCPQPLSHDHREETGQGGLEGGQQEPGAGCEAIGILYGEP